MPARRLSCRLRARKGSGPAGRQDWVVLLEAIPGTCADASPMDVATARALLRAVGGDEGIALQCSDRVAIQLPLAAPDATTALATAYTRWRVATRTVGAQGWTVVRAEVMSLQEFERDVEGEVS
jgi:hypothetical protein